MVHGEMKPFFLDNRRQQKLAKLASIAFKLNSESFQRTGAQSQTEVQEYYLWTAGSEFALFSQLTNLEIRGTS